MATAPAAPAAFAHYMGVGDYNIYEPFRSFFPVSKLNSFTWPVDSGRQAIAEWNQFNGL